MFRRFVVLVALSLTLSSCTVAYTIPLADLTPSESAPSSTDYPTPSDTSFTLSIAQSNADDSKNAYWTSLTYPIFSVAQKTDAAANLLTSLEGQVKTAVKAFITSAKKASNDGPIAGMPASTYSLLARQTYVNNRLLVVEFEETAVLAGANSEDHRIWTAAYDLEDGGRFGLMTQINGQSSGAFLALLQRRIEETGAFVDTGDQLAQELQAPDALEAWQVSSTGIDVIFNPMTIGPRSSGELRVSLSWSDIHGMVSPSGVFGTVFAQELKAA